jgi:Domain of unknown function (DUF397).
VHLVDAEWKKSSYSGSEGGNCVEVAAVRGAVAVRDSKDPSSPVLLFAPDAWRSFLSDLKQEEATL